MSFAQFARRHHPLKHQKTENTPKKYPKNTTKFEKGMLLCYKHPSGKTRYCIFNKKIEPLDYGIFFWDSTSGYESLNNSMTEHTLRTVSKMPEIIPKLVYEMCKKSGIEIILPDLGD